MAQISDNDPIYELLDKWHDEDQYEKILEKIAEVPVEERSNKLWFRKISALNNLKRFQEAKMEISTLSKRCTDDKDNAKLFYMLGYTFDNTNCELKALECYRHTQELNPDYEDIQELMDSCLKYAKRDLENTKNAFDKFMPDLADAFAKASDPRDLVGGEDHNYIALIEGSFIPTPISLKLPLDNGFFKCENDQDEEKVKMLLEKKYNITDIDSLRQWYGNSRIAPMVQEVLNAMENNVEIPVEKMNIAGRTRFEATQLVLTYVKEYLPKAGIAAWDFSAVLAMARLAYAADLITNTDFGETVVFFVDEVKKNFSSWEEFSRSVIIGAFYNGMCIETPYDINSATRFAIGTGILCMQNYPQVKWIG